MRWLCKNIQKKQKKHQKDQESFKPIDEVCIKRLQDNVIDENKSESLFKVFTKYLDETKNETFFMNMKIKNFKFFCKNELKFNLEPRS